MAYQEFLARLRVLVDETSQAEVAHRAGISQATLSRILSGQRGGRLQTYLRLIAAYPELAAYFVSPNIPDGN